MTPPSAYDADTSPFEWGGTKKLCLPIQMGRCPEGAEGSELQCAATTGATERAIASMRLSAMVSPISMKPTGSSPAA
jgi:hypothetical protein